MKTQTSARTQGFTIIELVIVIAIIGILAVVSVFGYGTWRKSIAEKEVQSELTAVSSAMDNYKNFNNSYPNLAVGAFFEEANATTKPIYLGSKNVKVQYVSGGEDSFCIGGSSVARPEVKYHIKSGDNTPKAGTCSDPGYDASTNNTNPAYATCSGSCLGRVSSFKVRAYGDGWTASPQYYSDANYHYVTLNFSVSISGDPALSPTEAVRVTFTPTNGVKVKAREATTYGYNGEFFELAAEPQSAGGGFVWNDNYVSSLSLVLRKMNANVSAGFNQTLYLQIPKSAPAVITFPVTLDTSGMTRTQVNANAYTTSITLKRTY